MTIDVIDQEEVVERAEEVRAAMLLLVARLTPREQSAHVLREAFAYPHRQIGDVLGMTETSTRQLITRARARVGTDNGRPASPAEQLRLLGAFLEVARTGNPAALADLARDPERAPKPPAPAPPRRPAQAGRSRPWCWCTARSRTPAVARCHPSPARRRLPVVAAVDPLRGPASDAAQVKALLQGISGPIVLVGHSYGGSVISGAANGSTIVQALVYVAVAAERERAAA